MTKKGSNKDIIQAALVLAALSYGITAFVKLINPEADCIQELWCPANQAWWFFGVTQGLFVFIQFVLGLGATFGALWLLIRKPYFTLSLVVSGLYFLLAFLNLFVIEPTSFQEPFVYPVALLDIFVGTIFMLKMLTVSRVDWSKAPKKTSLKQIPGYSYYFKKKVPWSAIFWLFAIIMGYVMNIGTLATDVEDMSGFAWLMGSFVGIYSIMFILGWRASVAYLAITENGEMEARTKQGLAKKYLFPMKEVAELKVHWMVFMPDEFKKGDDAKAVKSFAREEMVKITSKIKKFEDILKPKQRKMDTPNKTHLRCWPTKFELLDVNGKRLLKRVVNHEDGEEMQFYKALPSTVKITSENHKIAWNLTTSDYI